MSVEGTDGGILKIALVFKEGIHDTKETALCKEHILLFLKLRSQTHWAWLAASYKFSSKRTDAFPGPPHASKHIC